EGNHGQVHQVAVPAHGKNLNDHQEQHHVHRGADETLGEVKIVGGVENKVDQRQITGPALRKDEELPHEQQVPAKDQSGNYQHERGQVQLVRAQKGHKAGDQQQIECPLKEPLCAAMGGRALRGNNNGLAYGFAGHGLILTEFSAG